MLADTNFWIDLLREREQRQRGPATTFLAAHRAYKLSISLITWGELAMGMENSLEVDHLLWRVVIHPLSKQAVWQASRIQRHLATTGSLLGDNDAWIAGTALTLGLRLLTRDRDFQRVPRLQIVTY